MQLPKPKVKGSVFIALLLALSILINSCVEAVPPAFDFQDNLIIIDALASTVPGTSYATVQQTSYEFGLYRSKAISGCTIKLINADTQEEEVLFESDKSYVVDPNFKVAPLSKWFIEIRLPNGETYRSSVEATPKQVPIKTIKEHFNPEMIYDEGSESYTSGHEIRIDFDDPADQRNFFFYQYRAYEQEIYCKLCEYGVYRDGECLSQINNPALTKDYYTYLCDVPCWKISYNNDINIFSDEFANGKPISNLLVAKVPYTSKQDILVEVLQLNVSQDAYKHFRTLKDLVDNNSGFNAPLPAALIGNFTNLTNPDRIAFMESLLTEICTVATAHRIAIPPNAHTLTMRKIHAMPHHVTTSMHSDAQAGRPTEYLSLTAYIAHLGRHAHIATPTFDAVMQVFGERWGEIQ